MYRSATLDPTQKAGHGHVDQKPRAKVVFTAAPVQVKTCRASGAYRVGAIGGGRDYYRDHPDVQSALAELTDEAAFEVRVGFYGTDRATIVLYAPDGRSLLKWYS